MSTLPFYKRFFISNSLLDWYALFLYYLTSLENEIIPRNSLFCDIDDKASHRYNPLLLPFRFIPHLFFFSFQIRPTVSSLCFDVLLPSFGWWKVESLRPQFDLLCLFWHRVLVPIEIYPCMIIFSKWVFLFFFFFLFFLVV